MNYPLISEYIESIRNAEDNFDKLSSLRPVLGDDGSPIMSSGNFAVVFKMTDGEKDYAVKCFTKEQDGRDEAYRKIAEELEYVQSSYLVGIKYLPNELFVDSKQTDVEEFPVVVMDWVEGVSLDAYVRGHIGDSYDMEMLAYQFCRMASWLLSQPFAHGDLKPDNILVRTDGTLVLVDYDGMFVPSMRGEQARELGSPDYRHPLRTADDFNEHTDDFALAVLALTMKALALQPALLSNHASDLLLFSATDYNDLSTSSVLPSLRALLSNPELEKLYALFFLAHSQKTLPATTFQLFALERPAKTVVEVLSTVVTKEDLAEGVKDEFGVLYSKDGKKLLPSDCFNDTRELHIKAGTRVICDRSLKHFFCLRSVYIPDSVINIGINPFSYYHNEISLKCDSVHFNVKNNVLYNKKMTKLISFCSAETSYIIPVGVTDISTLAFDGCKNLRSVRIPASVVSIGKNPFAGCGVLSLYCDSRNFIVKDNVLYNEDMTRLISFCSNDISFEIPDSVTVIDDYAFYSCKSLHSVHIPNKVNYIGAHAFHNCTSLKSLHIPNSVTKISNSAFILSGLTSIEISNGIKSLEYETFSTCKFLSSVHVPNNVVYIGPKAFYWCESLQSVFIPNSVAKISEDSFDWCSSLKNIFVSHEMSQKIRMILPKKLHSKIKFINIGW